MMLCVNHLISDMLVLAARLIDASGGLLERRATRTIDNLAP